MSATTHSAFIADAAGERLKLPPVLAIAGPEEFLRRDALDALRRHCHRSGMAWERFDVEEQSAARLMSRLRSSSLFGERTAVIVKSTRKGSRQEAPVRFKEELLEYLARPSTDNLLVFEGDAWNGSYAVPKKVKQDFLVVECEGFKPWQTGEVERFVEDLAQRHGLKLARGVAAAMREACGSDLGLIDQELAKLALVVDGRPVAESDLAANLEHRGDDHAMALVDAIARGDPANTAKLSAGLAVEADPGVALMMMGLLESQLRRLCKLAELLRAGEQGMAAAGKAGMNPRAPNTNRLIETARRLPVEAELALYRELLDTDVNLKGGSPVAPGLQVAMLCGRLAERLAASGANSHAR